MDSVVIDEKICNGCGLCSAVCPHRLLREENGKVIADPDSCMMCGHCQAVCPVGAVQVSALVDMFNFSNLNESLKSLSPGDYDCGGLVQLMRSRRSCRNYSDREVPLDILEDLVKIGTTAPSGTNSQSWNFVILPKRCDVEVLGSLTAEFYRQLNTQAANPFYRFLAKLFAGDKLAQYYRNHYGSVKEALREWDEEKIDRLFHGASAAILITGRKDASCPGEDAMLATQNILLAAHALGLGTCLIGFVVEAMRRCPQTRRAMAVPAEEQIYSVIGLGYPAVKYGRVAGRRPVQPRVLHLGETG